MSLVVFPADIGFVLADGFKETYGALVVRSDVDSGPAKQRRVTTAAPSVVTVSYVMTSAERDWFEDFYLGSAAGGAVWFEWTHPVKRKNLLARFLKGQEPAYEPYKPDWIVSLTLEVLPPW